MMPLRNYLPAETIDDRKFDGIGHFSSDRSFCHIAHSFYYSYRKSMIIAYSLQFVNLFFHRLQYTQTAVHAVMGSAILIQTG